MRGAAHVRLAAVLVVGDRTSGSRQPLALVTADGKVYQIAGDLAANNNAKLISHLSHTVEITGDTMDMSGKLMITSAAVKMISK